MTVPKTTLASSDVRRGMKDDQGVNGRLSQYETESTAVVCVITADKHWHTELVTLPDCSPNFQD